MGLTIDNVCAREERSCSEEVRLRFKGLTICTSKWICGLAPAPVLANSLLLDVRLASNIRNSESPEAQKEKLLPGFEPGPLEMMILLSLLRVSAL